MVQGLDVILSFVLGAVVVLVIMYVRLAKSIKKNVTPNNPFAPLREREIPPPLYIPSLPQEPIVTASAPTKVVLFYNGTFCPIHPGHISTMVEAKFFLEKTGFFRVLYGYISPSCGDYEYYKLGQQRIGGRHRLNMIKLALQSPIKLYNKDTESNEKSSSENSTTSVANSPKISTDWIRIDYNEPFQNKLTPMHSRLDQLRKRLIAQVPELSDGNFKIFHVGGADAGPFTSINEKGVRVFNRTESDKHLAYIYEVISLQRKNWSDEAAKENLFKPLISDNTFPFFCNYNLNISSTKIRKNAQENPAKEKSEEKNNKIYKIVAEKCIPEFPKFFTGVPESDSLAVGFEFDLTSVANYIKENNLWKFDSKESSESEIPSDSRIPSISEIPQVKNSDSEFVSKKKSTSDQFDPSNSTTEVNPAKKNFEMGYFFIEKILENQIFFNNFIKFHKINFGGDFVPEIKSFKKERIGIGRGFRSLVFRIYKIEYSSEKKSGKTSEENSEANSSEEKLTKENELRDKFPKSFIIKINKIVINPFQKKSDRNSDSGIQKPGKLDIQRNFDEKFREINFYKTIYPFVKKITKIPQCFFCDSIVHQSRYDFLEKKKEIETKIKKKMENKNEAENFVEDFLEKFAEKYSGNVESILILEDLSDCSSDESANTLTEIRSSSHSEISAKTPSEFPLNGAPYLYDYILGIPEYDILRSLKSIAEFHALFWNHPRIIQRYNEHSPLLPDTQPKAKIFSKQQATTPNKFVDWIPFVNQHEGLMRKFLHAKNYLKIFVDVSENWKNYNSNKKYGDFSSEEFLTESGINFLQRIFTQEEISEILDKNTKIPLTVIHGDLWVNNLIFFEKDEENDKLKKIDVSTKNENIEDSVKSLYDFQRKFLEISNYFSRFGEKKMCFDSPNTIPYERENGGVSFLDWQTVSIGNSFIDVATLIDTAHLKNTWGSSGGEGEGKGEGKGEREREGEGGGGGFERKKRSLEEPLKNALSRLLEVYISVLKSYGCDIPQKDILWKNFIEAKKWVTLQTLPFLSSVLLSPKIIPNRPNPRNYIFKNINMLAVEDEFVNHNAKQPENKKY